jgi:hypothetical protein
MDGRRDVPRKHTWSPTTLKMPSSCLLSDLKSSIYRHFPRLLARNLRFRHPFPEILNAGFAVQPARSLIRPASANIRVS